MSVKKLSGDIGTYQFQSWSKIVNSGAHPPILKLITFKANQGNLPAGLIVALDADGKGVPYDPEAVGGQTLNGTCFIEEHDPDLNGICSVNLPETLVPAPEAVPRYILLEDVSVDASKDTVGLCLIHGVAIGANCKIGAVDSIAPDNATKLALEPNIILE